MMKAKEIEEARKKGRRKQRMRIDIEAHQTEAEEYPKYKEKRSCGKYRQGKSKRNNL